MTRVGGKKKTCSEEEVEGMQSFFDIERLYVLTVVTSLNDVLLFWCIIH